MLKSILTAATLAGGLLVPAVASAATAAYTTTDLNIRTGPGADYQRWGTIPGGGRVSVHGCLSGYNWCDVTWRGERGWVSGNYLAYSGERYYSRPISSIGVTIGLPRLRFDPYVYHRNHYVGRSWYRDRYLDRRELREERRDVRDARGDVRDARQGLREARRAGENLRDERRELKMERRDLRQERRELRRERRD